MKVWHFGADSSPLSVNGISRTVWLLSREQVRLGHDISVLVDSAPDDTGSRVARESGLKLVHVPPRMMSYARDIRRLLDADRPQIVHMHSVFVVHQATLGRVLQGYDIPYVVTPHGGLAPQVLSRGVVVKTAYSILRERPRFMASSAVALVTPAEERAVRSFMPRYRGIIRWLPNPLDFETLLPHRWQGLGPQKRLVFLGRFDVLVKGIDILIEIARLLPDVQVDLYGTEDRKTLRWLNQIRQNLPPNVTFHDPVFGEEKPRMLSQASLYLQPSRWEGFPVSVAECLLLGVPSVIADTLDLAQSFHQHKLGLVIPLDPTRAAAQIRAALDDEHRLREWSERGREFALTHFRPETVAARHIGLYEEVLATHAASVRGAAAASGQVAALRRAQIVPPKVRNSLKSGISRMALHCGQLLAADRKPRTIVLCYHSVERGDFDLSVDPASLRQQVALLRDMGFEFETFGDLVHRLMRWGPPRNNVACLTFDDGYEDNLTQAAPLLADMGVRGTIFVTTGLMLGERGVIDRVRDLTRFAGAYLSQRQVADLSREGFEIGSHTHTHANLARLSAAQMRWEVSHSKRLLEEAVGSAVRVFAYPFGKRNIHYTATCVNCVRESGYTGAAAVAFRSVNSHNAIRIYELPRFFVTRADSLASFRQKVCGQYDWLGTIQEQAPAWVKAVVSPQDLYD